MAMMRRRPSRSWPSRVRRCLPLVGLPLLRPWTTPACMKKYFESVPIGCWLHTGSLGRQQPCICLLGSSEGAGLLLRAVQELARESPPAKRKLTLAPKPPGTFHALQLRFSPETPDLRKLSVGVEDDTPVLEFTPTGLAEVTTALESWMKGGEDFGLHPTGKRSELGRKDTSSGELWFWVTMLP